MRKCNPPLYLLLGVFIFAMSFLVSAADEDKPKADAKTEDTEKDKSDSGKSDKSEKKDEVERGTQSNPVDTGLRKRWGYKQRLAEAKRLAEEKKRQKHEEWLAKEKQRREAIQRVREERAARKKEQRAKGQEEKAKSDPVWPADKLATITMKSGCTFQGIIMMETEEEITVKIKGGEMTIAKELITSVRRPPKPEQEQDKKPPQK